MSTPAGSRPRRLFVRCRLPGPLFALALVFTPGPATASSETQKVILQPGRPTLLRIDFNYNFQNTLPPFPKEPALAGKQVARGLLPTVPPTALLRNISENELLLNTDHTRDFVNGLVARYRSTYNGHVFFEGIHATSVREGLEIPYTLDLFTYEAGFGGWVHVRSGWDGEIEVGGQKWRLAVVDNLDGQIGPEDVLCLQRLTPGHSGPLLELKPAPRTLFLDGHSFALAFAFKPSSNGVVLEAALTETNLPLGTVSLAAQRCRYVRLASEQLTAVLDAAVGTNLVPAGTYAIEDCMVDGIPGGFRPPAFIRCGQKVTVATGQTTHLEVGPPLRNTIQVTRDGNVLRLTYQLLGRAGEQYEYYNWRDRPRFSVYMGSLKIGGGALPFG